MFVVVSGKEDYDNLKVACSEVFKEINDMVDAKVIKVKETDICLDFYLSGDYKVAYNLMIYFNIAEFPLPSNKNKLYFTSSKVQIICCCCM